LVQAVFPVRPELVGLRDEAETAPVLRPRHLAGDRLPLGEARFELGPRLERLALPGDRRRDLREPRAGGPVGVGLLGRDALDATFHSNLTARPVEEERGAGVRGELAALPALVAREE